MDRELIRGSVEDEPWPLALDSGPEELQSASLEGWSPNAATVEENKGKKENKHIVKSIYTSNQV